MCFAKTCCLLPKCIQLQITAACNLALLPRSCRYGQPQTAQHWQCGLLCRNLSATTILLTSMLLLNPWLRFPFAAIELCWNAHRGNIIAAIAFQPRISHATE